MLIWAAGAVGLQGPLIKLSQSALTRRSKVNSEQWSITCRLISGEGGVVGGGPEGVFSERDSTVACVCVCL